MMMTCSVFPFSLVEPLYNLLSFLLSANFEGERRKSANTQDIQYRGGGAKRSDDSDDDGASLWCTPNNRQHRFDA